ncbi:MAG TPA: threonine--tRNA ligase, partial [Candidatus Saccharimonadales bacterium]|nr:threonine--tRNA ligase [Candidatus Saccharimonadales bacterium]
LRHSAAHLLAQAVTELFPNTLLTIGPATKEGFFYDFKPEHNFKESDLPLIEQRMKELAHKNYPITHEDISKTQARELYKNNPFKLELIDGIAGETVGLSRQGDFYDLCRGGHVATTGELKNIMLTGISGSYWRADQKNAPLQRISGTAFFSDKELRTHLMQKELAAKYDHRKLGKEMDLFSFQEEGTGFPFYHPKGTFIVNKLKDFIRAIWTNNGYHEIITPTILDVSLWKQSGHYAHYQKHMYFTCVENKEYAVKPMNCPGSILVYKQNLHSYKELPLRLAEFGHVHRFELSGVLHGLFRVRAFTIDDTHMFCAPEQIEKQIVSSVNMIDHVLTTFGFENIHYAISTKPENAMGSDDLWQKAIDALKNGLSKAGKEFEIYEGEGAFYGPKIEITIFDSMGRSWQCSTVQVDFFAPQNFDLYYINNKGEKQHPVIIHQALFGSLERFFGILLEHFKGHLPFWLCPTQIKVLPITSDQLAYAQHIFKTLIDAGLRVELDENSEPLSAKIKVAQIERIPWMLVVGQKEMETNTITLRHVTGKQEFGLTLETILQMAHKENKILKK